MLIAITSMVSLSPLVDTYLITTFGSTMVETPPDIEVYWDITAQNPVTEIAWGEIDISGEDNSTDVTVYVANEGPDEFYGSITTETWNPSHSDQYITLSWDFGDSPLKSGRIRKTRFTLRVDHDIVNSSPHITNFNFTIVVTGTSM